MASPAAPPAANLVIDLEDSEEEEEEEVEEEEEEDEEQEGQPINAQIIDSLGILQAMTKASNGGGNGEGDDGGASYKAKTKMLLEQLYVKLEEDVEYQRSLEEQIDALEDDLKSKELEVEFIKHEARKALEDTKQQADDMAAQLLARVSAEVSARLDVERVMRRLQKENSRMLSDLRLHRVASGGSSGTKSAAAHLADAKLEAQEAQEQLQEAMTIIKRKDKQRQGELAAVGALVTVWESRINSLNERVKTSEAENADLRAKLMAKEGAATAAASVE